MRAKHSRALLLRISDFASLPPSHEAPQAALRIMPAQRGTRLREGPDRRASAASSLRKRLWDDDPRRCIFVAERAISAGPACPRNFGGLGLMWENGRNATANRVMRGGSWNNHARNVRAACRNNIHPENRNDNVGFRCVRAQPRPGWRGYEQAVFPGVLGASRVRPNKSVADVLVGPADARRTLIGDPWGLPR